MAKEFTDAFAFLAKLCEHYELPRRRCIVVPGNHDINRSNCEAYFSECKGNGESPVFPWFSKWKHYKAAFDAFYAGIPGITFDSETPWSLFVNEDLRVVIAGLNSTMDEGHDAAVNAEERADKGHHGLCTEPQLDWFKKRLSEPRFDGWLRIGAVHHNTIRGCRHDNENLRDSDLLGGILADYLHLLLHGHTHEAKADMLEAKVRVYSTGSASLKTNSENAPVPTDIPNQYQFLTIQRKSITRYCRQYAPRNSPPEFIADVRQSKSKSDWIIPDSVDFHDVNSFGEDAEFENHRKETRDEAPPIRVIPTPPAFYAKPDYIGSNKFVGRAAELQALTDWAKPADPTNLLLFEAIGGNGKSMLTWEWTKNHALAARLADSPWAGRFWYSFYEDGAIMADFCQRALAYMTRRPLEDYAKKKMTELKDELLAQLHARPWLLILDGLERVLVAYHRIDAAELPDEEANAPTDKIVNRNPCDAIRDEDNDLLHALAAAAPSKLLISSRLTPRVLLNPANQPIPGVRSINLPGLRPPDAETLLRSCGIEGNSAAIQRYLTTNCDNHPLVIGILGGLIANYLPARGNFDTWSTADDGGAALDLGSLDLIQRRNHILRAALDSLLPTSQQLLSTLALLPESVDFETLNAFNPHLPPQPEDLRKPEWPENEILLDIFPERRNEYEAALRVWRNEPKVEEWLKSEDYRGASKKLAITVNDLEQRGLLRYDRNTRQHELHPVVRHVTIAGMRLEDRERHGQRVVDHFSSIPHNPWSDAATLEDLRPGIYVVRTLLKLGKKIEACRRYVGILCNPLLFNVEAYAEVLSIESPLFHRGWGILPNDLPGIDVIHLANDAAIALKSFGQSKAVLDILSAIIVRCLKTENWKELRKALRGVTSVAQSQGHFSQAERLGLLGLELADLTEDKWGMFAMRLEHFNTLQKVGRYGEAQSIWDSLKSMDRNWFGGGFLPGNAEAIYAWYVFKTGILEEIHLETARQLAADGKNRSTLRTLHYIRGHWRLMQSEWGSASASFSEAVRMARESGISDADSETGLALVKCHLGQLPSPQDEAKRLAQFRAPADRYLAMLWLAIGDPEQSKHHALAAYKWAWADGEPYVRRYELTKITELLLQLNVPIPNLPPYDPVKDKPFPWEGEVGTAVEKLRAVKKAWQEE